MLASLILPLLQIPLADPFMRELVLESYPKIVSHARRVHALAFPSPPTASRPLPMVKPLEQVSVAYALSSAPSAVGKILYSLASSSRSRASRVPSKHAEVDQKLRLGRWVWSGAAVFGLIGYMVAQGLLVVELNGEGGEERDEA